MNVILIAVISLGVIALVSAAILYVAATCAIRGSSYTANFLEAT
jgi:hypothetical protein